ncbi:MAG: sulfatase-like hydrolase/transferase [Rikenellaceae bacterium]
MKPKNLLCLLCATPALAFAKQKPNVIFILVDDLGKEWLDVYGGEEMTLKNINALSKESMVFNRAYSMPQSTPSRVSLITSQYPYNNGWVNHYDVPRWGHGANFDPEMNPCHPKLMQQAGYKTCVAGKWQLNDFRIQPNAMNDVGFDEYFMWTGGQSKHVDSNKRYWDPYIHSKEGSKTYEGKFGPDLYNQFILDFITTNKKQPFYVYYPMILTHMPFTTTPHSLDATTDYQKQMGMVAYMDFLVGKLVQHLKDEGVYDNTYLFFTTDNGTCHTIARREGRYIIGGKGFLSENGINAPFIVKIPGVNKAQKSDAIVSFTDIGPTALDIAGASKLIDPRMDGKSLLPVLKGKTKSVRKWTVSLGCNSANLTEDLRVINAKKYRDRAVIGEEYKIFVTVDGTIDRIYKIVEDPYETKNLIGDAKVKAEVEAYFKDILASMPKQDSNPKYTKLRNAGGDVKPAKLNQPSETDTSGNFKDMATEDAYLRYKNGGSHKRAK